MSSGSHTLQRRGKDDVKSLQVQCCLILDFGGERLGDKGCIGRDFFTVESYDIKLIFILLMLTYQKFQDLIESRQRSDCVGERPYKQLTQNVNDEPTNKQT